MKTAAAALAIVIIAALQTVYAPATATAQINEFVAVTLRAGVGHVVLGETVEIAIDVVNTGTEPTPPLVIHVDITDLTSAHSVDPEDWTSTLSKTLGVVGAGETASITWSLQPISRGTYSVYAVALSSGVDNSAISNVVTIEVTDHRSLNPGGILPVALAAPTIIGSILALQIRRNRMDRDPRQN